MGIKAAVAAAIVAMAIPNAASAKASANVTSSPAKGETKCLIKQLTSEYLTKEHEAAKAKAGISFYMQTMSYLTFRVQKSGAVLVAMNEDIYPGSTFYFMIDGKRYSGRAGYYVQLDSPALNALRQDKLIDFTYTHWPYRNEISRKDVFSGFSAAYDECLLAFGRKPKPAKPAAAANPPPAPDEAEEQ